MKHELPPKGIKLLRTLGFSLQVTSRNANGREAVKVDRTTGWGNPFVTGKDGTAAECVAKFKAILEQWERDHPEKLEDYIAPLRGKNLACWCDHQAHCHRNVLLEFAAKPPKP